MANTGDAAQLSKTENNVQRLFPHHHLLWTGPASHNLQAVLPWNGNIVTDKVKKMNTATM
jgi:hypothetical protein